jgi:hypothetical protein
MRSPLALSHYQHHLIAMASRAFSPGESRDQFLAKVQRHLFGQPTDLAVSHAINIALDAASSVDGTARTA